MYDLAIIGLGPAGLEAANIAIKNGLKVIAFEKNELGGTCLNVGCIPTKAILHCAGAYNEIKNCSNLGLCLNENPTFDWQKILNRKTNIVSKFTKTLNMLLSKKMTLIKADAEVVINDTDIEICAEDNFYQAKNILIATGSKPKELPQMKFDSKFILSSDDMYNLDKLPKSIAIVGSGAIGLEWAMILSNFDVEVTIIEKAPVLAPTFDVDIQKRLERILKLNKIKYYKNDFIENISDNKIILNSKTEFSADCVLVAVGREAVLPKISVIGCQEDFIIKSQNDGTTDLENVFMIGDATNGIMLAHNASYQARSVMEHILSNKAIKTDKTIPSVVYINPQIASSGLREQDIDDKKEYIIKKLPVAAIAKAWCDENSDGFIKVIIKDNKILGAHLICEQADSLITLLNLFIEEKRDIDEIKNIIFPHPSLMEGILEVLKSD